ncbi:NAD-dependent epimerase/dehydratase family protein [Blastococcus carthaginiensis]|uniref:NAD-dependent epimerase/dehydratase family protein n=1 Tax=Blastococcus carthaginiensis TaxID=3050034 RepID=UPI003872FCB8
MVFGASGFVGSAAVAALRERGADSIAVPTPRFNPVSAADAKSAARDAMTAHGSLLGVLAGADAVINAAGLSDATSSNEGALIAANAAVPGFIAGLCSQAAVARFVHVSSAAVQGDRAVLDDGPTGVVMSPYSRSKSLGEELVRQLGQGRAVVYRPPGVHAASRAVTRSLARLAGSPLAAVASPGNDPTPQSLLPNVADAIAFLALHGRQPSPTVAHPWEGLTTGELLDLLGGRRARRLPRCLARSVVAFGGALGRTSPRMVAHSRRLEVLWFGQSQAESWLTRQGWRPPVGIEGWAHLGRELRRRNSGPT